MIYTKFNYHKASVAIAKGTLLQPSTGSSGDHSNIHLSASTWSGCIGQSRTGRCRNTIFFGHGSAVPFLGTSSGKIGHLQSKAQCRETFHKYLALVGCHGSNVDGSSFENQCKALVGIHRFALLSENGSARVHG